MSSMSCLKHVLEVSEDCLRLFTSFYVAKLSLLFLSVAIFFFVRLVSVSKLFYNQNLSCTLDRNDITDASNFIFG